MAEETPIVGVSLEEEPASIVGPGQPSAPPVPATPPGEPEPEGTIAAATGEKFVPLAALQAERGKRKDAEGKILPDAELQTLKDKAKRYDEGAEYLERAKPIIERIRQQGINPQPQTPAPTVDPALEQEAIEYAKDFDLYTPEGKPDVARAMRIIQRNDARAAKQAQQAVTPILQTEAQRQSHAYFQHYAAQPEVNGIKVDTTLLAETWKSVPPEISADPRVAQVLFMNTIGRQILSGHKPIQAPPPPVVPTEGVGTGTPQGAALTDVDEKFLRASGMKRDAFTQTREIFKPGQPNSLE